MTCRNNLEYLRFAQGHFGSTIVELQRVLKHALCGCRFRGSDCGHVDQFAARGIVLVLEGGLADPRLRLLKLTRFLRNGVKLLFFLCFPAFGWLGQRVVRGALTRLYFVRVGHLVPISPLGRGRRQVPALLRFRNFAQHRLVDQVLFGLGGRQVCFARVGRLGLILQLQVFLSVFFQEKLVPILLPAF